MRGKRSLSSSSASVSRITPAYAGKTGASDRKPPIAWDHPRVCRENLVAADKRTLDVGSPPRMRGKHVMGKVFEVEFGITPAYAGKT